MIKHGGGRRHEGEAWSSQRWLFSSECGAKVLFLTSCELLCVICDVLNLNYRVVLCPVLKLFAVIVLS